MVAPAPNPPLPLIAEKEVGISKKPSAVAPVEKVQSMFHGEISEATQATVASLVLDDYE